MSRSPASSSTTVAPTTITRLPDPSPKNDHRLLVVGIVLGIAGAFLLAFIIRTTLRLKRRQESGEVAGPYQGTQIHNEHLATHITPFAPPGVHMSASVPRYKHNPGEDMRIAFRRPDGAWHFADSRTPFTPIGVDEIDVVPSPISSATSLISFNSRFPPTPTSTGRDRRLDSHNVQIPTRPPAVYHREPCSEHFDDHRPPG